MRATSTKAQSLKVAASKTECCGPSALGLLIQRAPSVLPDNSAFCEMQHECHPTRAWCIYKAMAGDGESEAVLHSYSANRDLKVP